MQASNLKYFRDISSKTQEKRPCRKTLLSFLNRKFYPKMDTIRAFFPKIRTLFLIFRKWQWRPTPTPPPPPPPSCAPVSVAEIASISLNIPKYPWKCLNKLFGLSQDPEYRDLTCLTGFWRASGSICVRVLNMT